MAKATANKVGVDVCDRRWKVTAAVLRGDQSHWRHVSFVLMSLAFPIFALILAFEWESSSDRQLVKYYTIVLALIWGWVMLIIGSRQMRARRISHHEVTDPHAPPPNVLPGSVPRYAREHSMPPSGALLTILHRAGVLSSNQLVPYAECDPVWPLPRGLLPAAIHVDIGKGMPVRRLHPLVAAGVIRVVPEGCVTAEFRLIKLEPLAPHKDGDNVCPELYWSECGFAELHPETQDMMSNRIVMVRALSFRPLFSSVSSLWVPLALLSMHSPCFAYASPPFAVGGVPTN